MMIEIIRMFTKLCSNLLKILNNLPAGFITILTTIKKIIVHRKRIINKECPKQLVHLSWPTACFLNFPRLRITRCCQYIVENVLSLKIIGTPSMDPSQLHSILSLK
jgi:hypothetical protein